jgi:hypothetical protein
VRAGTTTSCLADDRENLINLDRKGTQVQELPPHRGRFLICLATKPSLLGRLIPPYDCRRAPPTPRLRMTRHLPRQRSAANQHPSFVIASPTQSGVAIQPKCRWMATSLRSSPRQIWFMDLLTSTLACATRCSHKDRWVIGFRNECASGPRTTAGGFPTLLPRYPSVCATKTHPVCSRRDWLDSQPGFVLRAPGRRA